MVTAKGDVVVAVGKRAATFVHLVVVVADDLVLFESRAATRHLCSSPSTTTGSDESGASCRRVDLRLSRLGHDRERLLASIVVSLSGTTISLAPARTGKRDKIPNARHARRPNGGGGGGSAGGGGEMMSF